MVNIAQTFEEKLKAHIEAIEGKAPLEIVPAIVKQASSYKGWSTVYGLVLAYIPVKLLIHTIPLWHSYTVMLEALLWGVSGILIAALLRKLKLFQFFISKSLMREKALKKAESIFLHEAVFETKQRLGILIAVFELEKTVIVLADKGFNAHIPKEYWSKLGVTLAHDFDRKNAGDEFFQALEKIEEEVAHKFKFDAENANELSDKVRKH